MEINFHSSECIQIRYETTSSRPNLAQNIAPFHMEVRDNGIRIF